MTDEIIFPVDWLDMRSLAHPNGCMDPRIKNRAPYSVDPRQRLDERSGVR